MVPVVTVLHSVLVSLEGPQPRRPWLWALSLRQMVRLPHPGCLVYLALGGSIYASLTQVMPGVAKRFEVVDHPYAMATVSDVIELEAPIRFGYFGVGHNAQKGFGRFVRLAEEIKRSNYSRESEFVMVGFLRGTADGGSHDGAVVGVSHSPLSREEYARRAQGVTYAVGMADPAHYRLVASASFLDALCYVKPGIYLRNRYLEYYFDRMGDVGYLCSSYSEVRETVLAVRRAFPEERYRQQCANILRGRRLFEPGEVGKQLRAIIDRVDLSLENT